MINTALTTTYLGRRLADYGLDWPAGDHADALACYDLEERLAYGLHLYQLIQERDEADQAANVGRPYNRPAAERIRQLLASWLTAAQRAIAAVDVAEADGGAVASAGEFRRTVVRARHAVATSVDDAADVCDRIAATGLIGTKTTEDLRRELQARLGT